MRPRSRTRLGRVLTVAALVVMSGVSADASAASSNDLRSATAPEAADRASTTDAAGTTDAADAGDTAAAPAQAPPGMQSDTIAYGPFNIPAAPPNEHIHTGNRFVLDVEKPCTNCYITGMQADLAYPDGRRAGWSTGAMLHHMVMFNSGWGNEDATCSSGIGFLGQRFFASGDERTPFPTVGSYGYRTTWLDSWRMIYELANHSTSPQDVMIEITYDWVPSTTFGITEMEPVWLDVDQCGDSEVAIPAGESSQSYTWTVNEPGRLMHLAGHIHDHGVNATIRNDSTGELLCDSVAGYGESPLYIDHHGGEHISSMSVCENGSAGLTDLSSGQQVTLTSHYDAPEPIDNAMGISIMYVAQE